MEQHTRILNVLLVVCAIAVPTSLILLAYFYFQHTEIMQLKSELLSKTELQSELLSTQPADLALLPHIDREIAFVLNPNMQRATWRAAKGKSYPVNSLGLRGEEIGQKEKGTIRILVVGDSMVFGYKLPEEDKLTSVLNTYTSSRLNAEARLEFITVALPAWNIRSAVAFLERHVRLLDPDAIVWWSSSNDIEDTVGVVPPGLPSLWASPQAEYQSPSGRISGIHKQGADVIPALALRHRDNWELIAGFHARYGIPIVMMGSNNFPEHESFKPDWVAPVPKAHLTPERWNVTPTDSHPSAYANHIVALGILARLEQTGIIPAIDYAPEDIAILREFEEAESSAAARGADTDLFVRRVMKQTPTQFDLSDEASRPAIVFGVGQDGEMSRSGTLLLKAPAESARVLLHIVLPPNMEKYPGSALFSVRGLDLVESRTEVELSSAGVDVVLPLPTQKHQIPLYEISWLFDYAHCRGPSECFSGTLVQARFDG